MRLICILASAGVAGDLGDGLADGGALGGLVDDSVGVLLLRQSVIALGAINLPLEFGDVAQIVQGERIVGIDQVCLIEERPWPSCTACFSTALTPSWFSFCTGVGLVRLGMLMRTSPAPAVASESDSE